MGYDKRELPDFLEHVDDCTTAAIAEHLPLVTRSIVSIDRLRSYLTTERLRRLLLYVGSSTGLEDPVRTRYLAVFAILLSINKGIYLPMFVQHDHMADAGLPFLTCHAWPDVCQDIFDKFYKAQWKFCPKRLIFDQLHDTWLHQNMVVPFKQKELLKEGVDAIIFKVEVFEEYNQLVADQLNLPPTNVFILKSSLSDHVKLHNNEVEAYRTLLSHPSGRDAMQHMARFYGSWTQGETCNILREYVSGGTLTNFFERTEPPTTKDEILEFWKNFIQFIKPIACIHHLPNPHNPHSYKVGLHNDIKPDNILVSEVRGNSPYSVSFKLADLGLAGFVVADELDETQLRDVHGTKMYSAPEYFRGETDRSRQQSIKQARPAKDIWALACVISEAAVWSVFGQRGLDDYHYRRVEAADAISTLRNTGYSGCFHDTTKVLSAVGDMHKEVNYRCRANIDNVVGSVLLIVSGMMMQDPNKRPDAGTVYDGLTRAIDLATPPAQSPIHDTPTRPHASNKYTRHSVPANLSPSMTNGLGFTVNADSRPVPSDVHGHHPDRVPERRTTISGDRSPRPTSGASMTTQGVIPRRDTHSPAPNTTHETHWSPLSPINSAVPQPNAPVRQETRPSASIAQVLEHIRKKKAHLYTTLPGEEWLNRLHGRDQIFLIDDSESMRQHWGEVKSVFEALAYLVKPMDRDGIELHFANSRELNGREKHRKGLTKRLEKVKPNGQCQMGIALSDILPKYYQNQHQTPSNKRTFGSPRVVEKPPVNIYILTDGVWSPGQHCLSVIQGHITRLAHHLAETGRFEHVGIQFIRFGDNETGKERLEILDNDELKHYKVPIDIVDTEPSTGNVFKMLLASTDPSWDNEPSG